MKDGPKVKGKTGGKVVRLEDLAPREQIQGGAGKLRFGERREDGRAESREFPDPGDSIAHQRLRGGPPAT